MSQIPEIGTRIKLTDGTIYKVISGGCADCVARTDQYLCGELPPCTTDDDEELLGVAFKECK